MSAGTSPARRSRHFGVAGAAATLLLAGCGGPSDEQQLARWRSGADAACDRAEKAIRAGGQARNLGDLERVSVRAGDEVLAAADDIQALAVPAKARPKIAPVLRDLAVIRRDVADLRTASKDGSADVTGRSIAALKIDVLAITDHAKAAGLRRCARESQATAAVDELSMPGFALIVGRVETDVLRDYRAFLRALHTYRPGRARVKPWRQFARNARIFADAYPPATPTRLADSGTDWSVDLESIADAADATTFELRAGSTRTAAREAAKVRPLEVRVKRKTLRLLAAMGAPGRPFVAKVRRQRVG